MTDARRHHNPYIAGKALTSDDSFYDREDIIKKVRQTFVDSDNNLVVLFGQRRTGKTSILLKLERSFPDPFFPIYIDLMDKATKTLIDVLYDIAATCADKAGMGEIERASFLANPNSFEKIFLPKFYDKLGDKKRPVFLFDEFDVFDPTAGRLYENTAGNTFQPYLRNLIVTNPKICYVFVVGRRMEQLTYEYLATFKRRAIHSCFRFRI